MMHEEFLEKITIWLRYTTLTGACLLSLLFVYFKSFLMQSHYKNGVQKPLLQVPV
jgi:hypothetical protein